jgi:hypothetical protein
MSRGDARRGSCAARAHAETKRRRTGAEYTRTASRGLRPFACLVEYDSGWLAWVGHGL